MSDVSLHTATAEDLARLLDWAAAEGWNPGLGDAAAFLAADPAGVFVAGTGGVTVAGISVVNHGAALSFLGLYLCHPDWRGRGIGYALWSHALMHAGGRTVGLDGVAAQEANYARSGFVRAGATRRYAGRMEPARGAGLRDVTAAEVPALVALDAEAGGAERRAFMSAWLMPEPTRQTVVREDLQGFATIRACREGAKIGPVIAPDPEAAMALIRHAAAIFPEGPHFIDLPEANGALRGLLIAEGFEMTFETARMYRGPAPKADARVQAIATMELG